MRSGSRVHELWQQQPGLFRGFVVDVVTALVLGALTIAGGHERTSGRAWVTLNDNGGPYVWGAVLGAAGIALLAAACIGPQALRWMLLASAVVYGLFAWWFLTAAVITGASWWGAVLCIRATVMHVSRSDAYRAGASRP